MLTNFQVQFSQDRNLQVMFDSRNDSIVEHNLKIVIEISLDHWTKSYERIAARA